MPAQHKARQRCRYTAHMWVAPAYLQWCADAIGVAQNGHHCCLLTPAAASSNPHQKLARAPPGGPPHSQCGEVASGDGGMYRPLTKIRGTTLENFDPKSGFFKKVGFQKAYQNYPPEISGLSSRSSAEQTRQKRRYFCVGMQDLWISKNALLKSAPYFKKPLILKNPLFS